MYIKYNIDMSIEFMSCPKRLGQGIDCLGQSYFTQKCRIKVFKKSKNLRKICIQ